MLDANFWQDKSDSQKTIKEKKLFEDLVNSFKDSATQLKDLDDLYTLATDENNLNVKKEVIENIKETLLATDVEQLNRLPPIAIKILAFVDDDRVIAIG